MLDVWIRDVTVHEFIPNRHGKNVTAQWMQSYKESVRLSHYDENNNALIHISSQLLVVIQTASPRYANHWSHESQQLIPAVFKQPLDGKGVRAKDTETIAICFFCLNPRKGKRKKQNTW